MARKINVEQKKWPRTGPHTVYCNLQKRFRGNTHGILTTPASDVHKRLKANGTAIKKIKIAKRLLTINNKRKIVR